jgi:hypothetical protein
MNDGWMMDQSGINRCLRISKMEPDGKMSEIADALRCSNHTLQPDGSRKYLPMTTITNNKQVNPVPFLTEPLRLLVVQSCRPQMSITAVRCLSGMYIKHASCAVITTSCYFPGHRYTVTSPIKTDNPRKKC